MTIFFRKPILDKSDWFEPYEEGEFRSIWYLKFYERTEFVGVVLRRK